MAAHRWRSWFTDRTAGAVVSLLALAAMAPGCSSGSSGGGSKAAPAAVTGTVRSRVPVAGATVSFVPAADVEASSSLQAVEDLAPLAAAQAVTDAAGSFAIDVPPGRYFIHVAPDGGDLLHLPGGSRARQATEITDGGSASIDLRLSQRPPASATYVGSSRCLGCHSSLGSHKGTLHAVGLRQLGPGGPILSSLQDLSGFPGADQALASFEDGNAADNTGAGDGHGLRIAGAAYNVLLGKDATGYFQALESLDGLRVSAPLRIEMTYGGEGLFRQVFIAPLDATGAPAAPAASTRQVLPAQFTETVGKTGDAAEVTAPGWELVDEASWAAPPSTGAPPGLVPPTERSFDARCAGCHFTGMDLRRSAGGLLQASAATSPGGALDYDGDGQADEVNVGCEGCHGPGSAHAAQPGTQIVQPEYLDAGRGDLVCGRCHVRGTGNAALGGGVVTEYPSIDDASGGIDFPIPGISPAELFGTADGAGILPDFGSSGGYFNPVDLASAAGSWQDAAGGFGARHDHARDRGQHYFDHARSPHARNGSRLLACWDCHDPHARTDPGQVSTPAGNNQLCLGCHAGNGDFAGASVGPGEASADAVHEHVKLRTFDLVGVSMNLGPSVYLNPETDDAMGRCTTCHMPRTARSGNWVTDADGFAIRGDISSHTFDNISPATGEAMGEAAVEPVPNSCVECHRGILRGAWPDYRFQAQD